MIRDCINKLVDKGYLLPAHGNTFEFFETPQAATQPQKELSEDGQNFVEQPSHDNQENPNGHIVLAENKEIDNSDNEPNKAGINNRTDECEGTIQKPQIKEVTITSPRASGSKRPISIPKGDFVF